MAQHREELDKYPIQSLNVVLEQIYVEHNKVPPLKYSLSASAREAFFKFAKPQDKLPSTQGASAEKEANCNNSKRNKHVLRLALSMHVLYDRLRKAINLEIEVTSHKIALGTLNMAITLAQSLEIYKGISHTVSSKILHMYLYD